MSNTLISLIKGRIFTPTYIRLYPLSPKENIVEKINTYDYSLNDEFTKDINTLYSYLCSDYSEKQLDAESLDRNLETFYKTKKVKHKDKETKTKTIEKIRVEKSGFYNESGIKVYTKKHEQAEEDSKHIDSLIDRLLGGEVTAEDIPELDKTLKRHKFKTSTYIAAIVAAVVTVAAILIICH